MGAYDLRGFRFLSAHTFVPRFGLRSNATGTNRLGQQVVVGCGITGQDSCPLPANFARQRGYKLQSAVSAFVVVLTTLKPYD